jgi:hypothetical protein
MATTVVLSILVVVQAERDVRTIYNIYIGGTVVGYTVRVDSLHVWHCSTPACVCDLLSCGRCPLARFSIETRALPASILRELSLSSTTPILPRA